MDLTECCAPLASEPLPAEQAQPLSLAFKALGDPIRLQLLSILLTAPEQEVCACDLVVPVHRSQPTVSHHLKVLREANLVSATRKGTNVWYQPNLDQLEALRDVLATSNRSLPVTPIHG